MKYNYLFSFFLLLVGSGIAEAQQGIVKGKILDAVNRESLAGAAVQVVGSNTGAVANLSGDFQFYTAPGDHSLVVRYLGYRDTTVSITVQAGKVSIINFNLRSTFQNLSAVVVTGTLQGQSKALNQQKNADNIKNVVASDQIGRFPDPNVAEALQRVPGVNISRDQGEGRYVLVRGLAPQFTNVNVNGEQIPSPEGGVRYVALDAIPSDQLASMEISKSLTPDMDGDAIGGSVNLITRTAQSKKANISGSLVGGYNNLMEKTNVQGQLQYGQRLGKNEKLGIMLNSNYYQNRLGSDNWEYAPVDKEVELRDYQLTRTRLGLSSTIDYKFNPKHEVYVRGLYSKFTDRERRRRYIFAPEDEEIAKVTKDRYESQSILSVNMGAKHTFPKFFVNYETQYSYGEQDTPYDYEVEFIAGIPSTISFPTKNYPVLQANGYTDNTKYEFDGAEFGKSLAKDRNLTAKIDIGVPYRNGLIKFGGKVRAKRKSYSINANTFENQGGVPTLDAFAGEPVKDVFLGNRYDMSNPLDISRFNHYFNTNPAQFELDVEGKAIDEALEAFEAEEDVYAVYGMARKQLNKLLILGGVRYEKTTVNYQSKDVVINAAGDLTDIRPVTGNSTYDFILPQLHFRYKINEFTNVRAAATYTYARPNFSDIVPAQEINQEDNIATIGNPNLKPVSAVNFDLLGEHYLGSVGVISAGFFHKRLDAFIYQRVLLNSPYPLTGNPIVNRINVQQSQNGNEATLTGFELAYQGNLTFLPGFLKNFTLYANYTYTHSNANIQNRTNNGSNPDDKEKLRLPGQASNVGNLSLGYEWKKLTARASMNFNGSYLNEIGSLPSEDVFIKNRAQLDFSVSFVMSNHIRFFAECMNLTNQPLQSYMGNENVIVQREFYSWWSRVGIKFNL